MCASLIKLLYVALRRTHVHTWTQRGQSLKETEKKRHVTAGRFPDNSHKLVTGSGNGTGEQSIESTLCRLRLWCWSPSYQESLLSSFCTNNQTQSCRLQRVLSSSLTLRVRVVRCHSNDSRTPIANPTNSAQLPGTLYHYSSYIRVCAVM